MDRLLRRVRDALRGAARPERPGAPERPPPPSRAALRAAFREALERAAGRWLTARDEEEARRRIEAEFPGERILWWEEDPGERDLREAGVGVDRADLLVAETGTVVRTHATREAARLSLLPPVSVFLAREEDLVPDLPEALRRLAPRHRAGRAHTVLVTGPSRTADIEKELVIPAHGPRELLVLLLEAPEGGRAPGEERRRG